MPAGPSVPPTVTVGMPVRNGAAFLAEAIRSILDQTYGDLELLVSDNASTDGSAEIAERAARADPRVVVERQEADRGPAWNFNHVAARARGRYFTWAACDDLRAPTYLERCVEVLEAEPAVVLCHAETVLVDDAGRVVEPVETVPGLDAPRPHERFGRLVRAGPTPWAAAEIYGVVRTEALRSLSGPPLRPCGRGDKITLAELALLGRIHHVPEPLFLNRGHPGRSVHRPRAAHPRGRTLAGRLGGVGPWPPSDWFDPALAGRIVFPEWRILREHARGVRRQPLPAGERLRCSGHVAALALRRAPTGLARDVLIALEQALRPSLRATARGRARGATRGRRGG